MAISVPSATSYESLLADAIDYAVAEGADVINMSLSICSNFGVIRDAVEDAFDAGVVLVASSGNFPSGGHNPNGGCPEGLVYPAAYPEVIAVGAVPFDGRRWELSHPDLAASAGNVGWFLTAPGGELIPVADRDSPFPQNYNYDYGGTSAAGPHVAGVAALVRSVAPGLSPTEVADILTQSADPAGCAENDDIPNAYTLAQECGWGLLDAEAALDLALDRVFTDLGGRFAGDFVIPAGETVTAGAVTLEFGPAARLIVEGTLDATGTVFVSESNDGWHGIRVQGGDATLSGAIVDVNAAFDPSAGLTSPPTPAVAVTAGGHLVLDGTNVIGVKAAPGRPGTAGVVASGTGSYAEVVSGSEIQTHEGWGLQALAGGQIFMDGEITRVASTDAGGALADGVGSRVTIAGGRVETSQGPGLLATMGGWVRV